MLRVVTVFVERSNFNQRPEEEGIKTCSLSPRMGGDSALRISINAPRKRGLKLHSSAYINQHYIVYFNQRPEEEGIKTNSGSISERSSANFNQRPEEEGIKTR